MLVLNNTIYNYIYTSLYNAKKKCIIPKYPSNIIKNTKINKLN